MRSLFRHAQQPPLRPAVRRPLMPTLLPDDQASCLCPFIRPHRHLLLALQLHPELHPALAPLRAPFFQPQQPSHSRLFRAL
jgi:hypothetical protein